MADSVAPARDWPIAVAFGVGAIGGVLAGLGAIALGMAHAHTRRVREDEGRDV